MSIFCYSSLFSQLTIDSLTISQHQVQAVDSEDEAVIEFTVSNAEKISFIYTNLEDDVGTDVFKLLERKKDCKSLFIASCSGHDRVLLKLRLPNLSSHLSYVGLYVSDTGRRYSNTLIYEEK